MDESKTADTAKTPFPSYLFGFKGRIGPRQFFIGVAIAVGALIVGFGFFAAVMSPTGKGAETIFLAFPLFGLFLWILASVTVQRLRDADKNPALALVFILGPILLLYPAMELIEVTSGMMFFVVLGVMLTPGFIGAIPKDDGLNPNA